MNRILLIHMGLLIALAGTSGCMSFEKALRQIQDFYGVTDRYDAETLTLYVTTKEGFHAQLPFGTAYLADAQEGLNFRNAISETCEFEKPVQLKGNKPPFEVELKSFIIEVGLPRSLDSFAVDLRSAFKTSFAKLLNAREYNFSGLDPTSPSRRIRDQNCFKTYFQEGKSIWIVRGVERIHLDFVFASSTTINKTVALPALPGFEVTISPDSKRVVATSDEYYLGYALQKIVPETPSDVKRAVVLPWHFKAGDITEADVKKVQKGLVELTAKQAAPK